MIVGEKSKKKKKNRGLVPAVDTKWQERYEVEEDLRAVARAKAVEADPERMKKVKALAKEKLDESKRKKDEAEKLISLAQE